MEGGAHVKFTTENISTPIFLVNNRFFCQKRSRLLSSHDCFAFEGTAFTFSLGFMFLFKCSLVRRKNKVSC